jgi:hypothetical protein
MDEIDRFAEQATLFRQWATDCRGSGAETAREGLVRITRLYAAGLDLPSCLCDNASNRREPVTISSEERQAVYENCSRLPFRYYSEVFNPLPIPAEEPVVGDLADDVADIFRDVMRGLQLYTLNYRAAAGWEWVMSLQSHWGEHATSAIRALHCWIVQNEPDCLNSIETGIC